MDRRKVHYRVIVEHGPPEITTIKTRFQLYFRDPGMKKTQKLPVAVTSEGFTLTSVKKGNPCRVCSPPIPG